MRGNNMFYFLLILSFITAYSKNPPLKKPIKIGVLFPLTGEVAAYGQETLKGFELGMNSIDNKSDFEWQVENSLGTTQGSVQGINNLILNYKAQIILGDILTRGTLASAPIAARYKIPMLTPASTGDHVTESQDGLYRICYKDAFQGKKVAEFAFDFFKINNVVILMDGHNEYSRQVSKSFKKEWISRKGTVLSEISYGNQNFQSVASRVKKLQSQPFIIFIPGYPQQVGPLLKELQVVQIKAPIIGADGWDSVDLMPLAGTGYPDHYFVSHYSRDTNSPLIQRFQSDFRKKYSTSPGLFAALGYDSALAIQKVFAQNQKPDSKKFFQGVSLEGVTGKISWDKTPDPIKEAFILKTTPLGEVLFKKIGF
jgi:branched-chain amino acid transport system substrate-binding protein